MPVPPTPKPSLAPLLVLCALAVPLVGCGGAQAPAEDVLRPASDTHAAKKQEVEEEPLAASDKKPVEAGGTPDEDGGTTEPTPAPVDEIQPVAPVPPQDAPAALSERPTLAGDDGSPGWAQRRALRRAREELQRIESMRGTLNGASCTQTCELAEAICASRDVICEVGRQYRDARGDCDWADAECRGAEDQCRSCRGQTAGGPP